MLIHLRERKRALRRMIDALEPGGWVLIEDFDCSWRAVEPDGEPADSALFAKVVNAFYVLLRQAGTGLRSGVSLGSGQPRLTAKAFQSWWIW